MRGCSSYIRKMFWSPIDLHPNPQQANRFHKGFFLPCFSLKARCNPQSYPLGSEELPGIAWVVTHSVWGTGDGWAVVGRDIPYMSRTPWTQSDVAANEKLACQGEGFTQTPLDMLAFYVQRCMYGKPVWAHTCVSSVSIRPCPKATMDPAVLKKGEKWRWPWFRNQK